MLPTLLAMDKHEQQQEESQDDGESDDHECTVSAKKVPAFELEYTVKGAKHTKLFFGELKTQADLNFAQLHGPCVTKWIQQMANLRGNEHRVSLGLSKLSGVIAMRETRNLLTDRMMCGWPADHRPGVRPSPYHIKCLEKQGALKDVSDIVMKIRLDAMTARVLPRAHKDCEPLWVCLNDIHMIIAYINKTGKKEKEHDVPTGVRKRINKKGEAVYQIKKADKMQSFKTLVEAVEVLNQQ